MEAESSPATNLVRRVTARAVTVVSALPPSRSTDASSSSHATPKKTRALHDLIAGGVAGSAGIIVGHPLDSLKVRMQLMASSSSQGAASSSTIRMLAQSSQFGSVWNGIGAPLAMAAVINASIFLTYGGSTRLWDELYVDPERTTTTANNSFTKNAVCGGITGLVSSFIVCPTEHIKTKLQTNHVSNGTSLYRDSFHAAEHTFTNHGIAGLYRGFSATIARQSLGFVVYFGTYDRLKKSIRKRSSNSQSTTQYGTLLSSVAAGGLAGSLSWAIVYPMDLIKSRIQALPLDCRKSERSIIHVAREVVQRGHGWRALYRGFGITIMRAFPVNGIIFPTYEFTLSALKRY
mmetsp:Transcript_33041/g.69542  ORF Transcript_33041/g.69542 Transcript_33041/m.69542 type:complete len:347 (+) Transcript_33041:105-1145(+)|eukprot:CAMPEP_0172316090 /NCGR_PEP_ID=MMETSP1058-20130122/27251_1 /TAXON_ID=83371 /ORGANISM="Detonula confervacea, Strain CCMP 353" /LENGTH=346 /DNA_ID=CAMNT_0013030325 /DNA_START=34 /DNA_END=1074 /DNA_ORIENTATION=-